MSTILLKGGRVIILGDNDQLSAIQSDALAEGNTISEIGRSIAAPPDCDIIDRTDKIVPPSFVDAHRHMWETALKGLCEDLTCVSYFARSK